MTRVRPLPRLTPVLLAAAVCTLASCSGSAAPSASPAPPRGVGALDRAIASINTARDALVASMNRVVAAANRVDAVDAVSGTGDWKKAATVRAANPVDVPGVVAVVGALPARVGAYTAALNQLAAAANATGVPARPAEAVRQVVSVGRVEAAADDAFVRAVVLAWPAYAVLSGLDSLWYERASGGWYDTTKLAAQEYTVLTGPNRASTTTASERFAATDGPRRDAADAWAQTLREIEPILHPA